MYDWHKMVNTIVDEIDNSIQQGDDEGLALSALARRLGYSEFHASRKFHEISGLRLRDYLRLRRLAYALIQVRDTRRSFLDIGLNYGFSSHEAFTRAFKAAYGTTPKAYRNCPRPVVLRTKINTFDRYTLGIGEIGMVKTNEDVKVYFATIPAHKFLHIKNYDSQGYFDFWEKQEKVQGQQHDTICGLLDSIKGKLDGRDDVIGLYSGHIMGHIHEDGKRAEAYGVRLPADYAGEVPPNMLMLDIPEAEYIVFEHGPFDFDSQSDAVGESVLKAAKSFDYTKTDYELDDNMGRIGYFYFVPEQFYKHVKPVRKN